MNIYFISLSQCLEQGKILAEETAVCSQLAVNHQSIQHSEHWGCIHRTSICQQVFSGNGEIRKSRMYLMFLVLACILIPMSSTIASGFKLDVISGPKMTDDHSLAAVVVYGKGQKTVMGYPNSDLEYKFWQIHAVTLWLLSVQRSLSLVCDSKCFHCWHVIGRRMGGW